MLLGDLLQTARAQPIKPYEVEFNAIDKGPDGTRTLRVKAVLIPLDEGQRTQARVDALAEIERRWKDKAIPAGVQLDEEIYQQLQRALCQPEPQNGSYQPIAMTVLELRSALVLNEGMRLWREYKAFMEREFPESVDAETWARLVDEAKKRSLQDLLIEFGYAAVIRAATSLAAPSLR